MRDMMQCFWPTGCSDSERCCKAGLCVAGWQNAHKELMFAAKEPATAPEESDLISRARQYLEEIHDLELDRVFTPEAALISDLVTSLESARKELERAREDAERYHLWRKHYHTDFALRISSGKSSLVFIPGRPMVEIVGADYESKVDAAIDEARKEQG